MQVSQLPYIYLLAKIGDRTSYRNRNVNPYINSYMNISEKVEPTARILYIERFSKSGILIDNSQVIEKSRRGKTMKSNCKILYLTSKRNKIIWLNFTIMGKYVMYVLTDMKTGSQKY